MNTLSTQTKYIGAVAVQLLVIIVIIILKISVLSNGTNVLLQIRPVDPRDMLRGDYVTFQYEISNINSYLVRGNVSNGDIVYVELEKGGMYWYAHNVSTSMPTNGGVFLIGHVDRGGFIADRSGSQFNNGSIHVVYGAEQYFIPEGTGRNFNFGGADAGALLAVDDNGNAVIKQIYVNQKPWPQVDTTVSNPYPQEIPKEIPEPGGATVPETVSNNDMMTPTPPAPPVVVPADFNPKNLPLVMYWGGKVNQHWSLSKHQWQTDPDGVGADIDMLTYCRKFYSKTKNVSTYKMVTIDTWKAAGNSGNYTATIMADLCIQ